MSCRQIQSLGVKGFNTDKNRGLETNPWGIPTSRGQGGGRGTQNQTVQ